MLNQLSIHQFALVDHLELDIKPGMSVISGETGAGKSILLDALGLTLGERADASCIRQGAEKAEVSALFAYNEQANQWLQQRDIPQEDHIILRRVVTSEGRSRAYINGRSVPASDLKDLGHILIEVHSQQAHQRLLQKDTPRQILDAYAGLQLQTGEVSLVWTEWQQLSKRLRLLKESSHESEALKQLLSYQVSELRDLDLNENELDEIEAEHKRLVNAEGTLLDSQSALFACQGDDNSEQAASYLTQQALHSLEKIDDQHPLLEECRDLLNQAKIQLDEATSSLQRYLDQIDINPHRLQQVENRLSDIYSMARKHHIQPRELYEHWQTQEQALAELNLPDHDIEALEEQEKALANDYHALAEELSQLRQQAAQKLSQEVESYFESLALEKAKFFTEVSANKESANRHGFDQITFNVQTNPGMPKGPLGKVASGGELARISLALQVVTAASSNVSTLIFDEVDVGIGGGTAERVGRLLQQLGKQGQVLCVTHQPQVAAQAHQHYQVSKISGDSATHTNLRLLNKQQRAEEMARMLGGVSITQQTLAHAKEMLTMAGS